MSQWLKLSPGVRIECSDSNSQEVKSSWMEWMRALVDTSTSTRPRGPCWGTRLSDQAENCIKRCQRMAGPFGEASCDGLGVGNYYYFITAVHLQFAWHSTWQSNNGQGLEKSAFCKYTMGLRGFNMSVPFNHLQLTVIFLGSSSLFEDEGADLVEFYVEFIWNFTQGLSLTETTKFTQRINPSQRLVQTHSMDLRDLSHNILMRCNLYLFSGFLKNESLSLSILSPTCQVEAQNWHLNGSIHSLTTTPCNAEDTRETPADSRLRALL